MQKEENISKAKQSDYRILIVDDDLDFAASLKLILENEDYQPFLAHSEEEALESVAENAVDLALLDIRLGQDDGIDLLLKLKEIQPDILCVMVTGFGSIETAIQALRNGAYDYLRKPVNPDELLATLRRGFEKIRLIKERQARELRAKRIEADDRKSPPSN
jgi:DNA-binding NtrC family response regulator